METDIIEIQKNDKLMRPCIICTIPIKNEAWILDRCLASASLWADYIIVLDQLSTDGSVDIVQKYPKAKLIENPSDEFKEPKRRQILLDAARKINITNGQHRLIISLDADECLTANYHNSPEWQQILDAPKGTIVRAGVINIHHDLTRVWRGGSNNPIAFMDDGITQQSGDLIHVPRLPLPENSTEIHCKDIWVLHYQYTDWARMQSKHRWYMAYEHIHYPEKNQIFLFRMYHHMYGLSKNQYEPIQSRWFDFYNQNEIEMLEVKKDQIYWWDAELKKFFEKFGTKYFALLPIWQSERLHTEGVVDPRNQLQKKLHTYLFLTQPYIQKSFPIGLFFRGIDKILKLIF